MEHEDVAITPRERLRLAGALALLAALMLAAQSGCSSPARATREQSADATFKIVVDMYTDPSGVYSMFEMSPPAEQHVRWTGTAWVAEYDHNTSYLVTAGHVCESRAEVEDDFMGISLGKLKVRRIEYGLVAADGTAISGLTVQLDDDDADLCVLSRRGWLAAPLPIADADPEYGDRGWYSGAPTGVWGANVAMTYDLVYDGRGSPFAGKCSADMRACDADGVVVSGSVTSGASGSAALFGGRVVGVLNLGNPRFPNMAVAVPWEAVRRDLDRARHRLPAPPPR